MCQGLDLVCAGDNRGKAGREQKTPAAWWKKLWLVLTQRLHSLLPDGSRLKRLCVGWVGSPAKQRAVQVRRVMEISWRGAEGHR